MKTLLALSLTLISMTSAFAQDCGDLESTGEIYQCTIAKKTIAEERLAAILNKVKGEQQDEVAQGKFAKAQTAWEAYRDAECELRADAMRDGSFEKVLQAGCLETLTTQRAEELERRDESLSDEEEAEFLEDFESFKESFNSDL